MRICCCTFRSPLLYCSSRNVFYIREKRFRSGRYVEFQYYVYLPWLLLLLIPAAALVLFAYFRISKKYRRNRNRVLSTVLGMIMATCGVLLVSGITVNYDEKNRDNEMIVVVDASYSNARKTGGKRSIHSDAAQ